MVQKIAMKCVNVVFDEKEKSCVVELRFNGAIITFRDNSAVSNYTVGKYYNVTIEPQNG